MSVCLLFDIPQTIVVVSFDICGVVPTRKSVWCVRSRSSSIGVCVYASSSSANGKCLSIPLLLLYVSASVARSPIKYTMMHIECMLSQIWASIVGHS